MQTLLFQDNQIHSNYSDGKFTLEEILQYNNLHDKLDLSITDHVNKDTDWFPHYVKHLHTLRKKYKSFNVKIGCEVKILDDGSLNTTQKILDAAEVVLGSVHHFKDIKILAPEDLIAREYELTKLLAEHPDIDILSHPFNMGWRFHKLGPRRSWIEEVYRLCAKNGIKFEYNYKNAPESVSAFVREKVARGETQHLSFGSDMHENLAEIGMSGFAAQPEIPVLVTGAGGGVGQSILKALRISNVKTKIVTTDASPKAAGVYVGAHAYLVPKFTDKRYIPRIIEICRKEKVRFIFIGTDIELEILSKYAKEIKRKSGALVLVSNLRAVRIADDKWKTVQFLKNNGFTYPASCLKKDLPAFLKTATFPLVVKPRIGARSIGLEVVHTKEALERAVLATHEPVIQEYLATEEDEFTCSAFFYRGVCLGVIPGQRWLRNGDTYKALFKKDAELEKFIAKVGKKLNLFGPCNFQLRKTKRGPVIFEINCRFSGTTGAISFLGFNVANALLQILAFKRIPLELSFETSFMFRYWNELFVEEKHYRTLEKTGNLNQPHSRQHLL